MLPAVDEEGAGLEVNQSTVLRRPFTIVAAKSGGADRESHNVPRTLKESDYQMEKQTWFCKNTKPISQKSFWRFYQWS